MSVDLPVVLPVQHLLGYWGIGNRQELNHQLQELRRQIHPSHPIEIYSSPNEDGFSAAVWGVAFSGNPTTERDRSLTAKTGLTLGLSIGEWHPAPGCRWRFDAEVVLWRDFLILQRDCFGRVPLYWLQQDQVVWFASRWHWLLPLCDRPQLSIPAVYGYTCFSYVPTPLTPVADIANLPAGTTQTWTLSDQPESRVVVTPLQSVWEWQERENLIRDESIAIRFIHHLLQMAIQAQTADLSSDEPVGVFLSGGLDSSIVAALLVQAGFKVRAYTLNFGDAGISELSYATQVAEFLGIPLVTVEASPRKIRDALVPTAQALDLPFGDGVTVPLYLLNQVASQEVGVVFNGEGGDQLFAGWTNKPLIAAEVYQAAHPESESLTRQYLRTFHRLWGYEAQVFQPDIWAQVQSLNPEGWLQDALKAEACPSLLHQLRRANLMLKGAQNIQPRATHLGRVHGLKVRSPFCDQLLAHWVFGVSTELHLQGSCEKYILKRAVQDWLPTDVVWRPKRGMGVPLTTWFWGELWHDLGTWLNPAQLQQEGIWQPHLATQIMSGQLGTIQGRRIGECLWLLLMWQVWRQTVWGDTELRFSLNHPFWLPSWLGRAYCRFQKETD